ncbi:MAG: hypothetical protein EOM54_08415 [Clostridia bacterium]|nr:hypothetical protein [Clostridia bacterium]NCC68813.1 hypothetical protein [Clostridia bacterium]
MNIRITDLFTHYSGETADLRETDAVSPERIRQLTMEKIQSKEKPVKKHMGKPLKITLIAAAVVALLAAGALAVGTYITSESQALTVARRELQVWKDLGLITADVTLDGENTRIYQYDEDTVYKWPYRILNPIYCIQNYGGKYSTVVYVDTLTGKITNFSIQAWADEDAEPVPGKELVMPESDRVLYYYENFGDIFDPNMTVGEFCEKLADYWGYDGYTIGRTEDDFYGADSDGPADDALLTDCYSPYITVYFDGDQQGVPQFIQIYDFPGGAYIVVGIHGHLVG